MSGDWKERCRLLEDISALNFAALELTLYLDTHPDDRRALRQRNEYLREMKSHMTEYEKRFGPLTQVSKADYPWQWIEEPWPWELRCGGEV